MNELDFKGLADVLLGRASEFLIAWLPGGRVIGREYTCGSLSGGPGDSCKVNLKTGQWAEFAGDQKGGDLISLYACIEHLDQGEAAKRLADQVNYNLQRNKMEPIKMTEPTLGPPPVDAQQPDLVHPRHGAPALTWRYADPEDRTLFWVARYDSPQGKQFSPWSWDLDQKRWVMKGWPAPRPLYNLADLSRRSQAPVLVVEGEKAAEAARDLLGGVYAVTTWPNGAKASARADWTPVHGRKVLIWPDADEPGIKAAQEIAEFLSKHCPEIKVIDVKGQPEGWDAADCKAEGWTVAKLIEWARPRAQVINVVNVQTEPQDEISPGLYALWESVGIALTEKGQPICNLDNALRVFQGWPKFKDLLWYDEFHRRFFTTWQSEKPREWKDDDTLAVTAFVQRELGLRRLGDDLIFKAAQVYAHQRTRNEPKDWMETLKWDGVVRCAGFFVECLGVKESDYSLAIGHNFWVGMAARVYQPGCQLDSMVILEGPQGVGKTNALRMIGGHWFASSNESVASKDFFMTMGGKLIIEIAELDSFSKAEVTRIKQVVSNSTDRFRAPYARSAQDNPRSSIFVGTTNEPSYLRDNTGARRFWPMECGRIRLDLIKERRDQLFAEAVVKFKEGDPWYLMPEESTRRMQEDRRQVDEWENVIGEFVVGKQEIQIRDIADSMKIESGRLDPINQRRIARILRKLDWTAHKIRRGWTTLNVWRSPDYVAPPEGAEVYS